jgi:membrane protein
MDNRTKRLTAALVRFADSPPPANRPLLAVLRGLLRLGLIAVGEFRRNNLSLRAGALTYTILLSLVPMLAMSTALVKGFGGGDQLRESAYAYIATLEEAEGKPLTSADSAALATDPTEGRLTFHLRSALDRVFDYVDRTNFTTLGALGMAGILASVLLVLSHIESALNAIWKVAYGRSVLRKISDYLTLLILLPIAANIAFAAGAFLESQALAEKFAILVPFSWLQTLLLQLLPVLVIALTLFIIYLFFPNTRVETLPALSGAALAATGWFALQNIYISLQVGVANYNAIYGSFATLPLFLVWVYLGWLFVLGGAQLAYALQHLDSHQLAPFNATPALRLACAFDSIEQVETAIQTRRAVTEEDLAAGMPVYPPGLVKDVLADLITAGLLHHSESDGRLLPAGPGEDTQAVIAAVFGKTVPDTRGGAVSATVLAAAGATRVTPLAEKLSTMPLQR